MRLAHKHVIARDVQLVIDLDKLGKTLDFMHWRGISCGAMYSSNFVQNKLMRTEFTRAAM